MNDQGLDALLPWLGFLGVLVVYAPVILVFLHVIPYLDIFD